MKQSSLPSNTKHDSTDDAVNNGDDQSNNKNKKQKKQQQYPLQGLVVSVSTLKGDDSNDGSSTSYNYSDVCQSCKELGATVMGVVCKRVQFLICTQKAVEQATQRVRKAQKQNIPLVSVEWLEACGKQGQKVDIDSYRLESFSKNELVPSRRKVNTSNEHDGNRI